MKSIDDLQSAHSGVTISLNTIRQLEVYVFSGLAECYETRTMTTKKIGEKRNDLRELEARVIATREKLKAKSLCVDIGLEILKAGTYARLNIRKT